MSKRERLPATTSEADHRVLHTLATACRILGTEGHNDTVYGHMSARSASAGRFWLKGAGLGLDEIGSTDFLELDLDGSVLAGTRGRHLEYPIHGEIYRRRPDITAVVHTHPLYATVFGAIRSELRPLTHEGSFFVPRANARISIPRKPSSRSGTISAAAWSAAACPRPSNP